MTSKINKIAVIGTGVIGTGWIVRLLAHNKKITAFDGLDALYVLAKYRYFE